jgi:hypothetical protein
MNRTIPLILLSFFLFGCLHAVSIYAVTLTSKDLIMDVDDDTGRLNLSRIEGKDAAGNAERENLLFYDKPPSSYTLIYLDDDVLTFGGDRGRFTQRPVVEGRSVRSVWENERVRVTELIQIVERKDSGAQDGMLISYFLENKSGKSVEAGMRILFDTYLGERDIYHFELTWNRQVRQVWYETMFEKDSLPLYWVSKKEKYPDVCLRGVLEGELVTSPDEVIFANYRALEQNPINYKVRGKKDFDLLPYSKNDSAVAIFYSPALLQPGASREYSTILGLCGDGEYSLLEKPAPQLEREEVAGVTVQDKIEALKEKEEIPRIDIESIARELNSLQWDRSSLKRINELVDKLNIAIEKEGKSLSEDDIIQLRKELDALRKAK